MSSCWVTSPVRSWLALDEDVARRRRRGRNSARRRHRRRGGGLIHGGTGKRRPRRVDGKGLHDVGHCTYGGWHARHSALQTEFVASTQEAGAWVRKTNVKELRAIRSSRSKRQGDAAIDFFGPMQETAVIDFVVVHPLAATYSTRYGQAPPRYTWWVSRAWRALLALCPRWLVMEERHGPPLPATV